MTPKFKEFLNSKKLFVIIYLVAGLFLSLTVAASDYPKVMVLLLVVMIFLRYQFIGNKNYKKTVKSVRKMRGKSSGAHGSADFADVPDLKEANLMNPQGFILGKFNDKFIRFNVPGHLITFAPTRSGKGVGQVIPNLLDHPGSVVVNDIKGENYAISAEYRKKFSKVVKFAPFDEDSNHFNPLDFIRVGTDDELDDVKLIVDMIILEESGSGDQFWTLEAKNLVTCLLMHVATSCPPPLRNIGEVRYLMMQSKTDFEFTVQEMLRSKNKHVRKMAAALSATEPKVLASIMSTAKSQTAIWDSPRLNAITCMSDFKLEELKQRPTSLFIIIPPEYLDVYKPVIRLMIGLTLGSLIRTKGKPDKTILFLIDEFAALGYMRNIEVGIGYLAGYGISLWMFLQDLSQLRDNYPKWESFIANCAARVAFGTNDVETAKKLSDMMGTTTITVKSSGKSKDSSKMFGGNISTNTSETSRPLMTPDEVMRMPNDTQIVFVQGAKPILAEKIFYFKDPAFQGKYGKWD